MINEKTLVPLLKIISMKYSIAFSIIATVSLLYACGGFSKQQPQTESAIEEAVVTETNVKTVFNVLEDSKLYVNPSEGEIVLNQKATNAIGETIYCSIDPSCTVNILERQGSWIKIQVVTPDWLTNSHIGWVKSHVIEMEEAQPLNLVEGQDYKILLQKKQGTVTNYYIQNISCALNQRDLLRFAKALKEKFNCKCNIYIYEDDSVKELMTQYPLKGKQYIKVADKFAFELSFDGMASFYPFQDIQYKEFGGSNWKKEPIQ